MPGTPGARTGLATILTGDAATAFRTTANAIISWLEGNAAISSAGLLSARPTSTPGTPGIAGRKFYATDVGLEFRDTGTGWVPVGIPIGGLVEFAGAGDLTPELILADGRTLSSGSYATLDAMFGAAAPAGRTHAYNGGGSPGSGLFRLPDLRGRSSVAPDNMGTAQGAANRIPNSNRTLGQNGGEERHTLIVAELAAHQHDQAPMGVGGNVGVIGDDTDRPAVVQGNSISSTRVSSANRTQPAGSGTPHNNMAPYVITNRLIRIL